MRRSETQHQEEITLVTVVEEAQIETMEDHQESTQRIHELEAWELLWLQRRNVTLSLLIH